MTATHKRAHGLAAEGTAVDITQGRSDGRTGRWPDLLARPQPSRLQNRGGRELDLLVPVAECRHEAAEDLTGKEDVLLGDEEGGGEEVLGVTTFPGDLFGLVF